MTVYMSWFSVLTVFLTLQLPFGSFSKAMIKFEDDREGYLSAVEGICFVLSIIFLVVYLPFREVFNTWFGLPTVFILIMDMEILARASINFWMGKKRFEFRYVAVVLVTVLSSVSIPVLQYLLVVNTENKGNARIIGEASVTILVGITLFIIGITRGKKAFDKDYWKYALGFNLPLVPYYLSQIIFDASDRIMIDHLVGTDKAGIYGVAYTISVALNFVLVAINNSYTPWIYKMIKEGKNEKNKNVCNIIAAFMACILLLLIWMAPEAILIIGGSEYTEAKWIVPPVAMSVLLLFYTQISANYEFYFENKKTLTIAAIVAAVANIVLNYIFIPVFGYMAAGYTTLFSYIVLTFLNFLARKKVLRENGMKDTGVDTRVLLIIFASFIILGFIGMMLYSANIIRYVVIAVALFLMLIFRKKLLMIYEMIKRDMSLI